MTLDDDPNYIIVTTDEILRSMAPMSERAGVLLGVTAVLATTLIVLNSGAHLSASQSVYQSFLPLIFMSTAFVLYAATMLRNVMIMPYKYIHNKAVNDKIMLPDPQKDLPVLQGTLERVQALHRKKQTTLRWGNSVFLISILLTGLVNLVTYNTVQKHFHSSPVLAGALIGIIGALAVYVVQHKLLTVKPNPFNAEIRFREPVHLVANAASAQMQSVPQPTNQPQIQIVGQPIPGPIQFFQMTPAPEQAADTPVGYTPQDSLVNTSPQNSETEDTKESGETPKT